jgi:hypothetical protein
MCVHADKEAEVNASADAFTRIANVPVHRFASEEDVKITIVLPLLRALGYEDADVNDEGQTGRGYVDVVIERFPVGIVVETKSPRTKHTDEGIAPLETYVFHQHTRDRSATVAMLTNGEWFFLYGVIGPLEKGSLDEKVLYGWKRSELDDLAWVNTLVDLWAREQNVTGTIPQVITRRQEERRCKQEQLREIETAIQALTAERDRIDEQIQRHQSERTVIVTNLCRDSPRQGRLPRPEGWRSYAASPHILRLLGEQGAQSKSTAAQRQRLDEPLVGKVEGVSNQQAVSFALIKLKEAGMIDYVKRGGIIREVWLI